MPFAGVGVALYSIRSMCGTGSLGVPLALLIQTAFTVAFLSIFLYFLSATIVSHIDTGKKDN